MGNVFRQKKWKKDLPKIIAKKKQGKPAGKSEILKLDKSVANLASIVLIAEVDKGTEDEKRILLTGDARGDKIIEWLKIANELNEGVAHFDVIKLPHHGSDRNVDLNFFKTVTADHYIVSGNGGHGNPEPQIFEWLFKARPQLNYKIHMTYSFDELKKSKSFEKHDNSKKLAIVIENAGAKNVFVMPKRGNDFIDITL